MNLMGAPRVLVQRVHAGAGGVFGVLLFVILLTGAWSMAHEDLRAWFRGPAALAHGPALPVAQWPAIARERGDSSSSSACCGVIEKNAISEPLTKPEIKSATTARQSATIWATPKSVLTIAGAA